MGTMIDVTGASLPGLLAALGRNYPDVLCGYVTGIDGVDWPASYWTQLATSAGLFRYDQSPGLPAFASGAADGGDVEALAGNIPALIAAAAKREARGWYSWGYLSQSRLASAREAAQEAGLHRLQWIVADWNLTEAAATVLIEQNPDVSAVQWASPTSNADTLCPGTDKTLAELNVDLNVTRPGWFELHKTASPAPAPLTGLLVTESGNVMIGRPAESADGKTWTLT